MIKLALLLVVAVGAIEARGLGEDPFKLFKRQSNDSEVEVFPEFHLLNNGSTDEPSGLLLAVVGDDIGVSCVHYPGSPRDVCAAMGYSPDYAGIDPAYWYFNNSSLMEFPAVISRIETSGNTSYYYMDSNSTCEPKYIYLFCEELAPEPETQVFFELLSVDSAGEITTEQHEGMVIAIVVTDEDWEDSDYGSVCDDSVNQHAADVVCKSKGYTRASSYGNINTYPYDFPANTTEHVDTIMDQFNCPDGSDSVEECSYDLYRHDCSYGENLVVFCESDDEPTNEWRVAHGQLLMIDEDGEVEENRSEGLLYVWLENQYTGEYVAGTVCDDSWTDNNANVVCQALGYDTFISWANHGSVDFRYAPEQILDYYNVSVVMDEVNCPGDSVEECTFDHAHDCSHSEDVTLVCAGGDPSPEPPTWSPTSGPLDDEVEIKFGGLELQMKVNPRKGRAYIEDIIDYIRYGYY